MLADVYCLLTHLTFYDRCFLWISFIIPSLVEEIYLANHTHTHAYFTSKRVHLCKLFNELSPLLNLDRFHLLTSNSIKIDRSIDHQQLIFSHHIWLISFFLIVMICFTWNQMICFTQIIWFISLCVCVSNWWFLFKSWLPDLHLLSCSWHAF